MEGWPCKRYFHTELNETLAVPLSYMRKISTLAVPVRHVESKYITDMSAYMSDEKVERKLSIYTSHTYGDLFASCCERVL